MTYGIFFHCPQRQPKTLIYSKTASEVFLIRDLDFLDYTNFYDLVSFNLLDISQM